MPRPDRHRRGPVRILLATRRRYRRIVDSFVRGRTYRSADVFRTDDRECAEPAAHRGTAGRVHGFLRSPELGRHFRTRKELSPPMSTIDVGKKAPPFALEGTGGSWSL